MRRALAPALLLLSIPHPAAAQAPIPINPITSSFPGAYTSPPSALSASLALSDRWLANEPFANPAIAPTTAVAASPMLMLLSRQDLSANNREFSDQGVTADFAGAWAALPIGRVAVSAYFWQPVLRSESNSYQVGTDVSLGPPATLTNDITMREWIAGFGASVPIACVRLGAALEWDGRDDSYSLHEESGSPSAGDSRVSFSGNAVGAQFGARAALGSAERPIEIGAAARYLPSLELTGTQTLNQIDTVGTNPVTVTRASAWQGGVSARVPLGSTFKLVMASGTAGAQDWTGFGVTSGRSFEWKIAGEFHDARDPWTLRFGGGQEQQDGVPEPRAGVYSIGLGWRLKNTTVDVGLLHRTLDRPGEPTSYDERLLLSIRVP